MAKTVGITEEELYAAVNWRDESSQFEDIQYHKSDDGIANAEHDLLALVF